MNSLGRGLAFLLAVLTGVLSAMVLDPIGVGAASSATVRVDVTGGGALLAPDVVGLSYEPSTMVTSFDPTVGNLAAMFEALGSGNIRIGGNSLDRGSFYAAPGLTRPSWATTVIQPADLDRLASFSRTTGWKVELGEDLGHIDTADISAEAQAAQSKFGSNLKGVECGNEPNVFGSNGLRPQPWTYAEYRADWETCANAVGGAAPLAGPDIVGTNFLSQFLSDEGRRLAMVTHHDYTLSHCGGQTPTVTSLLSAASDANEVNKIQIPLAAAASLGVPFRIDETNTVACGGFPGVSNVYASTLWAVDYMLLLAQQGVTGFNFHGFLGSCGGYSAICQPSPGHFAPMPLFYGLLMTHLMGSGRFLPVSVSASGNLTAYAVDGSDGRVRIMVVDKDPTGSSDNVSISAGSNSGSVQVLRLTGASLSSASGINIQGATMSSDGTFAAGSPDVVADSSGQISLTMASGSAALLTLPGSSPLAPASPATGVSGAAAGGGTAVFSWNAPADDGGSAIVVYAIYLYSPTAPAVLQESPTTGYSAGHLAPGYWITTVTSWNGIGWSRWSDWSNWVLVT